jgi:hypothetical protein
MAESDEDAQMQALAARKAQYGVQGQHAPPPAAQVTGTDILSNAVGAPPTADNPITWINRQIRAVPSAIQGIPSALRIDGSGQAPQQPQAPPPQQQPQASQAPSQPGWLERNLGLGDENLATYGANFSTLGLGNPIRAGLETAPSWLAQQFGLEPSTGQSFGDAYSQRLAAINQGQADVEQRHPTLAPLTGLAMSLPLGGPLELGGRALGTLGLKAVPRLAGAASDALGGNMLLRGIRAALTGGAEGATAGGIQAATSGEDIGQGALQGAEIGGALGPVGAGVLGAGRAVGSALGLGRAAQTDALEALARNLRDAGRSTDDVRAALRTNPNLPNVLADPHIGGENLLSLGAMAAKKPGGNIGQVTQTLFDRAQASPDHVAGILADTLHPNISTDLGDSAANWFRNLNRAKLALAQPAYDQAYAVGSITSPGLAPWLNRMPESVFQSARDFARMQGRRYTGTDLFAPNQPRLSMEDIDYLQRGLRDQIEASRNEFGYATDRTRTLQEIRDGFLNEVDHQNPYFANARQTYSDVQRSQDALMLGQKAARANTNDFSNTMDEFNRMTPGDQDFFRLGYGRAQVDSMMRRANPNTQVKNMLTPLERQKLAQMNPPGGVDAMADQLEQVANWQRTASRALGGSPTAPLLWQDMAAKAGSALGIVHAGVHALHGNPVPLIAHIGKEIARSRGLSSEPTVAELQSRLFNTNLPDNLATLDAIDRLGHGSGRMGILGGSFSGPIGARAALAGAQQEPQLPPILQPPQQPSPGGLIAGFSGAQ